MTDEIRKYEHAEGMAQVVLLDGLLNEFADWLRRRDLHLFRMPLGDDVDDLTTYGVSPGERLMARAKGLT